jgi:hypothetical protein
MGILIVSKANFHINETLYSLLQNTDAVTPVINLWGATSFKMYGAFHLGGGGGKQGGKPTTESTAVQATCLSRV